MSNREAFEKWFELKLPKQFNDYLNGDSVAIFYYTLMIEAWQARVPEGYVVVPKEPTQDQLEYGYRCGSKDAATIYRVMVVAESEK